LVKILGHALAYQCGHFAATFQIFADPNRTRRRPRPRIRARG